MVILPIQKLNKCYLNSPFMFCFVLLYILTFLFIRDNYCFNRCCTNPNSRERCKIVGKVYDGKPGLQRRHCSWDGTGCHAHSSLKGSPLQSSSERTSEAAMYRPSRSNPTPDPRQLVCVMCGKPMLGPTHLFIPPKVQNK